LILAAAVIACLVFFRVDQVVISGNQRYTVAEIQAVTGVTQGENLITLNKNQICQRILRELPYVEGVNIRRGLPDSLIITVYECQATACIQSDSGLWLMNSDGKLLEQAEESTLTRITGVTPIQPSAGTRLEAGQEQASKLQDLKSLMGALEDRGLLEAVGEIDLSSASRMELTYEDRLTVYLPYAADYEYKTKALQAAIDCLEAGEESVVDLTFEDGPHLYPRS
jgi:cell division protein FtsQ